MRAALIVVALAACGHPPPKPTAITDVVDLAVNDEGCIRDVDTAIDLEKV